MKTRLICISFFFISGFTSGLVNAQDGIGTTEVGISQDSLLSIVLKNNKTLIAAERLKEASRLEAKSGNTPVNPSVEFGYLSGFPSSVGNRIDFRVEQEFDFPTAYFQKGKIKNLKIEEAGLIYDLSRQEIVLRAIKLYINRIYLNKMEQMLAGRLEKAETLNKQFIRMFEAGEVNRLALSQSNLQATALKAEFQQVSNDIMVNNEALLELTGGRINGLSILEFPVSDTEEVNEIKNVYANSLKMQLYESAVKMKETEKQLSMSKALPQFTAGYYSESVITEQFRGISLGMTIPLWEHANAVKYAKADISYAEAEKERFSSEQSMKVEQNMNRWRSMQIQIKELNEALSQVNDEELLNKALETGEISLMEYIFASEFYFQNVKKLLEYKRDLLLIEAELMKIFY